MWVPISGLGLLLYLAVAASATEVEIITEPRQGEEYVNIQASNSNPAVKETKSVVMSVSMSKSSSSSSQPQRPARQASLGQKDEVIRHVAPHDHSHHDHIHHDHHHHLHEHPHNHRTHDEVRYSGPTRVEINPEGMQGTTPRPADTIEKHVLESKSKFAAGKKEKKDSRLTKSDAAVEIRDTGVVGVKSHEAADDVPTYKHVPTSHPESDSAKYEVIGVSGGRTDEGAFDFVDLSERGALKPSATNQASRISIKKGPNGQDYEYEYVYYYYDEEDEDVPAKNDDEKPAVSSTAAPVTTTTTKKVVDPFDDTPQPRPAFPEREQSRTPEVREPTRATHQETPARGFQETTRATFPEPPRQTFQESRPSFQENRPAFQDASRTSYQEPPSRGQQEPTRSYQEHPPRGFSPEPTNVPTRSYENPRTHAPEQVREVPKGSFRADQPTRVYNESPRRQQQQQEEEPEPAHSRTRGGSRFTGSSTTQEPLHNEVVPNHPRQRIRGRVQQSEEVSEPVTQRFRGRTQEAEPTVKPRTPHHSERSGVRRPSLELVDSSSFRTHSADNAPPHQDIPNVYNQPQQHRGNQPAIRGRVTEDTRESDLPEYIEPRVQQRPTVSQPLPQPIQPQVIHQEPERTVIPVDEVPEVGPVFHPGAVIPQTVQPVVPSVASAPFEDDMPEKAALDLYALLSAASQESRDNEIDPDLTTLPPTTTTTTTTTTPAPTTQQGRGRFRGGSRTRLRPTASSLSRTTAAPAPAGGDQEQQKPVRGRFTPNRAGASRSRVSTTTTEQPQTERTSRAPLPRLRTRPRPSARPTEAPQPATTAQAASASPAPLRPGSRVRPLRPGPRLPTRTEPQPVPVEEEPVHEQHQHQHQHQHQQEEEPAPEPVPTDSALTRLRNRPRLSVGPRIRPGQQHGIPPRRKVEEPVPVPVEPEEAEEEHEVHTTPAPAPSEPPVTESRLTSLIRRRRPGQRIVHNN